MILGQRGVVLVAVLWVIVLLSFVVVSFVDRMQTETIITRNMRVDAECAASSRSLIELAISVLLQDKNDYDSPEDDWARFGTEDWREKLEPLFPGFDFSLTVWDEGSRINLNAAGQYQLERLFEDDPALAIAVLDWRDADQDTRASGAEDDYYQALEPPVQCHDGLLDTKLELKQIRNGMEYFERVQDLMTTFGPLNPNLITSDVFEALCRGVGIDGYLAERLGMELPLLRGKGTYIKDYDDLRDMPSMQMNLLEKLHGTLAFEGTYNINMMNGDLLALVMPDAGIESDNVDRIFRRTRIFRRVEDLVSAMVTAGMDHGYAEAAKQYVTVRSTIFGIEALAGRKDGRSYKVTAIVRRFREEPDDRNWQIDILSWREEPVVPVAEEGGEEPSEGDK